ncbi:MAG: hypothetical protein ACM31C_19210 [Acidobacteriota bacterium]
MPEVPHVFEELFYRHRMFADRRDAGRQLAQAQRRPARLVVAVPVAAPDVIASLRREADEVVRLLDASRSAAP